MLTGVDFGFVRFEICLYATSVLTIHMFTTDQNTIQSINLETDLPNLEVLSLNDNLLKVFDGRALPALRRLSLDRNKLGKIEGEVKLGRLESLSMERQKGGGL